VLRSNTQTHDPGRIGASSEGNVSNVVQMNRLEAASVCTSYQLPTSLALEIRIARRRTSEMVVAFEARSSQIWAVILALLAPFDRVRSWTS
jgi:hypothetical protein